MTNTPHRDNVPKFHALEVAINIIRSLRVDVDRVRRRSPKLATQIETAASSIAANIAEGNRRTGKDRQHFFRIAAGSADETRTHLRVAEAWGYLNVRDIEPPLRLLDRELAMLWRLAI